MRVPIKRQVRYFGLLSFTLIVFITACQPTLGSGRQIFFPRQPELFAHIDTPLDGAEAAVGVPLEVVVSAAAPNVVKSIVLMENNRVYGDPYEFLNPQFTRGRTYIPWTPVSPGTYTLQVMVIDMKQESSLSNIVTINANWLSPEVLANRTATPTYDIETPSLTITETLIPPDPTLISEKPNATSNQNLNCRSGPSIDYGSVWVFESGQTAIVVGRNSDTSWLVIEKPGDAQCWVSRWYVATTGNLDSLPIVTPPPLPATRTPTVSLYQSCADYPDYGTCTNDPQGFGGCSWDTGTNKCGP